MLIKNNYKSTIKYDNKAYRVFASLDVNDGRLLKCKEVDEGNYQYDFYGEVMKTDKKDKFGNTPDHCFICNDDIRNIPIPAKLDRQYYINKARERLEDFGLC